MGQDPGPAVETRVQGEVLIIGLNRPHKRNAVNREVAELVSTALDQLDDEPSLRVGVITGNGGAFCAGLDLNAHAAGETAQSDTRGFAGVVEKPPRKPLIAAVEGWALGGGLEILLCCDLRIAATSAKLGLPEVKRGLVARGGGAVRLAQNLARARAMEILLTGEPITGEQAYDLGLVNRVTPDGEAFDVALELAHRISANAPLAVAASKRLALESAAWLPEEVFDRQRPILDQVFASADAREGALAFRERRKPHWTGN